MTDKWAIGAGSDLGDAYAVAASSADGDKVRVEAPTSAAALGRLLCAMQDTDGAGAPVPKPKDSDHYALPLDRRREVVAEYKRAYAAGDIVNFAAWSKAHANGVCHRTIKTWMKQLET